MTKPQPCILEFTDGRKIAVKSAKISIETEFPKYEWQLGEREPCKDCGEPPRFNPKRLK